MSEYEYTPQEIKKIREKVIDYYGSASPFFGAAMADVIKVENMDDEEIIEEAERLRII